MHSAKEDIIFNKISKKLKKVLTYVERSDILSEYFWGKTSMKSKISRKIQKMLDFVKYIWYIGSTAEKVVWMIFENWAKCQFINS